MLNFFVFAVGLRDYAWTTRYSVLYIDNPVSVVYIKLHETHIRFLSLSDILSYTHDDLQDKTLRENIYFSRLEQVSASLMMTKVLLRTRMMLAEICTGKMLLSNSNVIESHKCVLYTNSFIISIFLLSALTQFFQIFPEYQSNEFYATGEASFCFLCNLCELILS